MGEPLPLTLFLEPYVYREAAITTLDTVACPWHLMLEGTSTVGHLSAVLAGLAVVMAARNQMHEGLRELGPGQGFPALPEVRSYVFSRQPNLTAEALIEAVQ